jgi:CheY-like chemotaxis protein
MRLLSAAATRSVRRASSGLRPVLVVVAFLVWIAVVLTAADGPGVERRVLEQGADDYILKPFDPDFLLSRVNAVFRRLKVMAA